ncbi:MAG: nucleotide pyrophosphohydrolase, partial [Gammaproteobacteria bacterium]
ILIYLLIFSDKLNLNLSEIISKKIKKNADKYPVNEPMP